MGTPLLHRVRIAVAVGLGCSGAFAALVAASPQARAGGASPLLPDLVTMPITQGDLVVERSPKKILLRFTNEIANAAHGPLEVFPSAASGGCDGDADPVNDRDAAQRIFADTNASGAFERDVDAVHSELGVGCMRYHAAHQHWHVLDFARYELRRERKRRHRAARASRKVGFCIIDGRQTFDPQGAPGKSVYPFGPPHSSGCDHAATQGLSPGWADTYAFPIPGQQLDVGRLRRGRFCLISRADPLNLLAESNERNNARRIRIKLRPRKLIVRKLGNGCRR